MSISSLLACSTCEIPIGKNGATLPIFQGWFSFGAFVKNADGIQNVFRTNQEDLVKYLLQNFSEQELETYKAKLMINLSPVAYAERAKEEKLDVV